MKQENWHLLRAAIFITISFAILPDLLPKIALHFSPGGLRMPDAPFLNAGMLAIFLLIAVFIKNYSALGKLRGPKIWEFIVFGALSVMEFAWFTGLLFAESKSIFWYFFLGGIAYGSGMLFLSIALLGLGVFKHLWKDMLMVASALTFYVGVTLFVDSTRFHVITAWLTERILTPFISISMGLVEGQPLLNASGFAVIIGPPCSGIFSMVLFTAFFSFIYWIDADKMNNKRAVTLYIIGVIGAFALNLLRVIALMLIGAFYSPDLAVGLFHTNAGWILFALYSMIFWWKAYPYITKSI